MKSRSRTLWLSDCRKKSSGVFVSGRSGSSCLISSSRSIVSSSRSRELRISRRFCVYIFIVYCCSLLASMLRWRCAVEYHHSFIVDMNSNYLIYYFGCYYLWWCFINKNCTWTLKMFKFNSIKYLHFLQNLVIRNKYFLCVFLYSLIVVKKRERL